LNVDDRFGTGQALRETGMILLKPGQFGCQWIKFGGLGAAHSRTQAADGPGIALAAPAGESGGVQPLPTQDGADATGCGGTIGLRQDPQLILRGERPAAGAAVRQFGRRSDR
jgi:hypothetical protein